MNEDTRTEASGADEPPAPAAQTPEASAGEPVQPAARVAALEAEFAALKDQALRALAETENVRRRGERDREDANRFAIASFAKSLLEVADNLAQALAAAPPEGEGPSPALRQGVELTEKTLQAVFERFGVSRFDALGQPFDPNHHQAVFEVEAEDKPAGTVVQVLRAGYMLNGRLLRPAMVAVAKGGAPAGGAVDTSA